MGCFFQTWASKTASIKKTPQVIGGKRGPRESVYTGVKCTIPLPANDDLIKTAGLDVPAKLLATYVEGTYDIREGYVMVIDGEEMPIKGYGSYPSLTTAGEKMAFLLLERHKVKVA